MLLIGGKKKSLDPVPVYCVRRQTVIRLLFSSFELWNKDSPQVWSAKKICVIVTTRLSPFVIGEF